MITHPQEQVAWITTLKVNTNPWTTLWVLITEVVYGFSPTQASSVGGAVVKWATGTLAVVVDIAFAYAILKVSAQAITTTARETLKIVITGVHTLFLSIVADASRHALLLWAAEGRSIAICVCLACLTYEYIWVVCSSNDKTHWFSIEYLIYTNLKSLCELTLRWNQV